MEINYINKWNKYRLGETVWINKRRDHFCRDMFIAYARREFKSVLEIGAGECMEARALKDTIDYTICDVSDTFLSFARSAGINTIQGCMTNIPTNKKFDIVYMCCVLEHTPDVEKTILELKRVSTHYFITMFKWKYTGGLESTFQPKKKYYSSEFNINLVFDLLEKHSIITGKTITFPNHKREMNYSDYLKTINKIGVHRNGNYLSIIGEWK